MDAEKKPDRFIKGTEVCARTGLSRITLYRHAKDGSFPAPVQTLGRQVAWWESDVVAWMEGRPDWRSAPADRARRAAERVAG